MTNDWLRQEMEARKGREGAFVREVVREWNKHFGEYMPEYKCNADKTIAMVDQLVTQIFRLLPKEPKSVLPICIALARLLDSQVITKLKGPLDVEPQDAIDIVMGILTREFAIPMWANGVSAQDD